ncbi:hypothetical protein CHS0354_002928 [Potamilus streckersoni]|uniref:Uncharacterized protein n=1 Tax=Potamilus streckersoni TaxID=2493646 RepID=A0AAE0W3G6_9BIVA|nr:hypothetical protein CHS0354_002928 [Potamilus streckersoni]
MIPICVRYATIHGTILEQNAFFLGNVIKLQPGQEAGTVYACINSPSLKCAKNFKLSDHCTILKDERPRIADPPCVLPLVRYTHNYQKYLESRLLTL